MTPTFQFFEDVCSELALDDEVVLPDDTFLSDASLHDLQDEHHELDPEMAVPMALRALDAHFANRQATLPFACDLATRTYTARDVAFISFVAESSRIRGLRTESRNFEVSSAERLALRTVGAIHRVGWPRTTNGKKAEFNSYLNTLGFNEITAYGSEKDGGLDILWLVPFGAIPHRPIFSFQCKNGSYDLDEAFKSNGKTGMSLNCHQGLSAVAHTICVIFNDYIETSSLLPKPFDFIPLGISDLAEASDPRTTISIL